MSNTITQPRQSTATQTAGTQVRFHARPDTRTPRQKLLDDQDDLMAVQSLCSGASPRNVPGLRWLTL